MGTKRIRPEQLKTGRARKIVRTTKRHGDEPPKLVGKIKAKNSHMDQKFCPVCWSLNTESASRSWETPRDIEKCSQCKHHSIRLFIQGKTHTYLHETKFSRHDHIPLSLAKKAFISKKIENPRILLVLPSPGYIDLVKRVFLNSTLSMKDRRLGKTNRSIEPDLFCVATPDSYDSFLHKDISLDKCTFVNFKYGRKSIVGRQRNTSTAIDGAHRKFGKFDLVITMDLLSQLLDPSIVINKIISSSDYFLCVENRYTSSTIKEYTSQLVFKEEENYLKNGERLVYPIDEDHHLKDFIKDQYQFFSSASLIGIFKNEAKNVRKEDLPKGKIRAFKVESIKEMFPRRQVAHNFPASYVDAL